MRFRRARSPDFAATIVTVASPVVRGRVIDRTQEKRERFLRVAERRTQSVVAKLRLLGNCGNPAIYVYDDEQIEQIFSAIDEELRSARSKFERKRQKVFRLK